MQQLQTRKIPYVGFDPSEEELFPVKRSKRVDEAYPEVDDPSRYFNCSVRQKEIEMRFRRSENGHIQNSQ